MTLRLIKSVNVPQPVLNLINHKLPPLYIQHFLCILVVFGLHCVIHNQSHRQLVLLDIKVKQLKIRQLLLFLKNSQKCLIYQGLVSHYLLVLIIQNMLKSKSQFHYCSKVRIRLLNVPVFYAQLIPRILIRKIAHLLQN